jgi:hypothetical protein
MTKGSGLRAGVPTLVVALAALVACARPASERTAATPVYSETTGRLEQLVSDRDGDGVAETRAFMDGARLLRIEIDRNADGQPDRWEYYAPDGTVPGSAPTSAPAPGDDPPPILRAEEASGPDGRITRREYYERGRLARVEEDVDADGRMDKWERYEAGVLVRVDLDLSGRGTADRRLWYGADGQVERVEADPDGDGTFEPAPGGPIRP